MSDILQRHIKGTDDAAIKAALVTKELGFNETKRHAIYKHENGIDFDTFPSESKLSETDESSGASLIGVDDSEFDTLSATQLQAFAEAVDASVTEIGGIWKVEGTDRVLYSGVVELERVTVSGNRSYNGAPIPDDLDPDYSYEIHKGGSCNMVHTPTGATFQCVNAYLTTLSGSWRAFNTGRSTLIVQSPLGQIEEHISTFDVVTPGNAGETLAFLTTKYTDKNGNIAYNGAAIQSGLDSNYRYEFRGVECKAYTKTAASFSYNAEWVCHNCYPISLTTFNFIDDSEPATITMMTNGIISEYTIPSTESNGFSSTPYETKRTLNDGGVLYYRLKEGASQVGAGATADELYVDLDYYVRRGI